MNLSKLIIYLREHRAAIVSSKDVLVEGYYSPTYGLSDPRVETLEYVDFDKLIEAIDDFSREFQ